VAHRRGITWLPPEIARETADAIPNAELVFLDGDSTAPYAGDTAAAFEAVEQFLAGRSGGPLRSSNGGVSKAREPDLPDGLTPREAEVLRLVAIGRTNQEIADELVLSLRTVEHHLTNVYGKTAMRRKPEAAAYALMHGLV
jgi:DNA-binding NarL/FixJ family response regulator